jgi:putative membrane protein
MAIQLPPTITTWLSHGGPHLGPWQQDWSFDLEIMIPAAIAVLLYARGLDRWVERTRPHSGWRSASFFAGVALTVLAVESPLDALGERHFSFHMIQHELMMMVAAPLILLGAPTTPMLLGMPRALRKGVVAPLARTAAIRALYRWLTHPVTALLLSTAVVFAWHLVPGWYVAALRTGTVHGIEHFSFMAGAMLGWWVVIDPRPLHARLAYPARIAYLLAASTPKAFIAAWIAFSEEPLFVEWYATVEPAFAISLAQDQILAGLLMWLPSQLIYLAAMAVTFFVWHAASESGDPHAPTGERALETATR